MCLHYEVIISYCDVIMHFTVCHYYDVIINNCDVRMYLFSMALLRCHNKFISNFPSLKQKFNPELCSVLIVSIMLKVSPDYLLYML